MSKTKKVFYVVNVDWFFLSHRLPLALAMKEAGHDVFILTKDTGKRGAIEAQGLKFINVDFERSGSNPVKELLLIKTLRALYKKHRPDIIHHVTIKPAIYGSIAAKVLKKVRIINAISGLGYNFIEGRDGYVQKVVRRLMKFAYSKNVNFIFQNPDDLNLYQSLGFLTKDNYKLIKGAGVDQNEYPYTEPVKKEKLEIVITARMLVDKGIRELIKASELLFEKWQGKIKFLLVGDLDPFNLAGMKEEEIQTAVKPGYLEWMGYSSDIKSVLKSSDIVCLPSYREGLPKSLIEAMAIGRPIVTTHAPGCKECVDEGVNGFMVPVKATTELAEALEKLISDEQLRLKMGKASRTKMMAEMSLQKVVQETVSFYY